MLSLGPELPDDIESCHAAIVQLTAELQAAAAQGRDAEEHIAHLEALLAESQETIALQQQTIDNLAADNALLKRSIFGSRRERFTDPAQTFLFDTTTLDSPPTIDATQRAAEVKKKRTSKGRQRRVFPEFLPRHEQRFYLREDEVPADVLNHPGARRFFKKIGETLEMIPMQLKVIEQFQEVIALDQPDQSTTMIAARRPVPLIQSFAGPSLWAYLTVSRFADHLPYYRLEDILGRSGVRIDCFFYTSDRRSIRPESMLEGFQGYLTADAYVAYERIGRLLPDVIKASCWVHGRRKFEACHHLGATQQTRTALAYFRQLFDIEDRYRSSDEAVRLAAREQLSRPIVQSLLAGAINYMLNRWESFTRFLECGAVPMDNNAAERALKYPILGRKAWLFFGNATAGQTAAKLFTLTKTCNRLRADPFAYLQDL